MDPDGAGLPYIQFPSRLWLENLVLCLQLIPHVLIADWNEPEVSGMVTKVERGCHGQAERQSGPERKEGAGLAHVLFYLRQTIKVTK